MGDSDCSKRTHYLPWLLCGVMLALVVAFLPLGISVFNRITGRENNPLHLWQREWNLVVNPAACVRNIHQENGVVLSNIGWFAQDGVFEVAGGEIPEVPPESEIEWVTAVRDHIHDRAEAMPYVPIVSYVEAFPCIAVWHYGPDRETRFSEAGMRQFMDEFGAILYERREGHFEQIQVPPSKEWPKAYKQDESIAEAFSYIESHYDGNDALVIMNLETGKTLLEWTPPVPQP